MFAEIDLKEKFVTYDANYYISNIHPRFLGKNASIFKKIQNNMEQHNCQHYHNLTCFMSFSTLGHFLNSLVTD